MMDFIPSTAHTIIIAPLNWGLGHATRCIPIIYSLLANNKKVILASDGEALQLLKQEFPSLLHESLPGYKVRYDSDSLLQIVLGNSTNIAQAIRKEKKAAKQLVNKHDADLIISDSRFGFRAQKAHNIIISHQLSPQAANSLLKTVLERGNRYFLNQFDECWIPDTADHKLSGLLSQNNKIKCQRYIGPLSRFNKESNSADTNATKNFDLSIILSGPEPARSKLETELIKTLATSSKKICLVRGTKELSTASPLSSNWKIYDRLNSEQLLDVITGSHKILSRSGYTSIMDYTQLGIGAYLIPTPGQTEQEYLAKHLDGQYGFSWIKSTASLASMDLI